MDIGETDPKSVRSEQKDQESAIKTGNAENTTPRLKIEPALGPELSSSGRNV